jgi:hypothetical protein
MYIFTVGINAADLRNIANNLKAGYVVERNGIPLRMGPTTITTYLGNITLNLGSAPRYGVKLNIHPLLCVTVKLLGRIRPPPAYWSVLML